MYDAHKQPLTPEAADLLHLYERGRRLQDTINTAGWADVLDILEQMVTQAEYALMNYNGSDAPTLAALHRRARTYREVFDGLQQSIQAASQAVRDVPDLIAQGPPEDGL